MAVAWNFDEVLIRIDIGNHRGCIWDNVGDFEKTWSSASGDQRRGEDEAWTEVGGRADLAYAATVIFTREEDEGRE